MSSRASGRTAESANMVCSVPMAKSADEKPGAAGPRMGRPRSKVEQAFDTWLDRELQRMFNDVAREPIPDDLLRLIDSGSDGRGRNDPPAASKPGKSEKSGN